MSSDPYGQIMGGIFGGFSAGMQTSADKDIQASANTRAWHRYLYARSTQYQTMVADLKAAGLNPMLAYTQGGSGAMMPSSASMASTQDVGGAVQRGMASGRQAAQFSLQMKTLDAARRKAEADASVAENMRAASDVRQANWPGWLMDTTNQDWINARRTEDRILADVANLGATSRQTNARTSMYGAELSLLRSRLPSAKSVQEFDSSYLGKLLTKFGRGGSEFNEGIRGVQSGTQAAGSTLGDAVGLFLTGE